MFYYVILYNILLFQLLKGILQNVHHPSFFFFVRVNTYDCGEKISNWLSKFFGRPYHLIKQSSDFQRNAKKKHGKGITFWIASRGIGTWTHACRCEHQSTKWADRAICSWSGGGGPLADRCPGGPASQQGPCVVFRLTLRRQVGLQAPLKLSASVLHVWKNGG